MGHIGDTISGVLQDGAGWGHGFKEHPPWQGVTRGEAGWAVWGLRGAGGRGGRPHTLPAPHLRGRGRSQLPARACIPGIWQRRGGDWLPPLPSDPPG